jgi:hypothetical protein
MRSGRANKMRRLLIPILFLAVFGAACGSDTEQASQPGTQLPPEQTATAENSPEGVARRFFEAIEKKDANEYLDALDPELRDEPGFGAAQVILQSFAGFFGVQADIANIGFKDLTFTEIANDGSVAQVTVRGKIRNLTLYQEEGFDETVATRKITGTWYVSELSEEEATALQQEQAPNVLANTFEGPQRCVVARYPPDWEVEDYGNLEGGYTSRCPGGDEASGTRLVETCDSEAVSGRTVLFSLVGPGVSLFELEEGTRKGTAPVVSVLFSFRRCQEMDAFLDLLSQEYGVKQARTEDRVVAGQGATCLDGVFSDSEGRPVRYQGCYFVLAGGLYGLEAFALEADWGQFQAVLQEIMSNIELHPITR